MATLLDIGVKFGAEGVPEITKSVAQLEAQMKRFQQGLNTATGVDSIARLNRALETTAARIKNIQSFKGLTNIPPAANAAATAINKLEVSSKAGFQGLSEFNRVVQDAPFGLIGIGNNITELPNAFRALSAASKESGQSISKILLGSLLGTGGLLTAISLVTTGLTFATTGFGAWTRGMGGSGDALKKAKEDTEGFADALKEVSQGLASDVSRVATLFNGLSSGSLNLEQRKKALDELKGINQEFFGSLKEEKGLINGLEQAYDNYLSKVLQIGRAKAIESQLTKLFDKKIQLELTIDPKFSSAVSPETQKEIGRLQGQLDKIGGKVDISKLTGDQLFNNDAIRERIRLQERILVLKKGENVLFIGKEFQQTQEQIQALELRIKGLLDLQKDTGNFDITGSKVVTKKEDDLLKSFNDELKRLEDRLKALDALRTEGILPKFLEDDAANIQQQIFEQLRKIDAREVLLKLKPQTEIDPQIEALQIQRALNEAGERAGLSLKVPIQPVPRATPDVAGAIGVGSEIDLEKVNGLANALKNASDEKIKFDNALRDAAAVADFQDKVANILSNSIQDLAGTLGEAITEIFSGDFTKGLTIAAQGILRIIGDTLQQIGKQVVLASTLIESLKKVLQAAGFGGASIAVGLGLIAAGAFIKNIKLPQFAEGGISDGPKSGYLALLHGREMITPLDRVKPSVGLNSGSGEFEIVGHRVRGEDLELVISRVGKRRGRTG